MSKDIVKALVTKKFSEAKELVFQSLYAKTALAMDDARMGVASSVFNAPSEQVDEGTGVPAGASKEKMEAARKANPYRVKLGKGRPAGASPADQDRFVEDVMDVKAEVATKRRIGVLANRATKFISGSSYGKAMGKYLNAHSRAQRRRESPIRYTAKGGRVIKAK